MRSRCPRIGHVVLLGAGLAVCAPAWGTAVSYTVDPTQSSLSLSGSWNGATLWQRPVGGLETSYSGSISAEVSDTSLQILEANLDADTSGRYRPRFEGRGGRQLGDYGGFFRAGVSGLRGNVNVALRDVLLDLSSAAIPLSGGVFDGASIAVSAAGGAMDYSASGLLNCLLGRGRSAIVGEDVANAASADGSLMAGGGLETLTIPIQVTLGSTIESPLPSAYNQFEWTLTGTIVATRTIENGASRPAPDVPEPATLSLLALGLGVLCRRRH